MTTTVLQDATAPENRGSAAAPAHEMERPSRWVKSPAWDGFWLLSGIWTPLVALAASAASVRIFPDEHGAPGSLSLYLWFIAMGVVHRMTTIYGVVASPVFRGELGNDRRRYIWTPLAIVVATFALCLMFTFHASLGFSDNYHLHYWPYFLLGNVFILWEIWHFGAQDFGVLSIYRVRAGQTGPRDRVVDRRFTIFMAFAVNIPLYAYKFTSFPRVWANLVAFVPFQSAGPQSLEPLAMLALLAGVLATVYVMLNELRKDNKSFPKIVYYGIVASYSLFIFYADLVSLALFFVAYTMHHWMVAIGLFSRVSINHERLQGRTGAGATLAYVTRFAPYALACYAFWYFNARFNLTRLFPLPSPDTGGGIPPEHLVRVGLIAGVFFSVNYLHYYYDACFYAFRRPGVRERVGAPLFMKEG